MNHKIVSGEVAVSSVTVLVDLPNVKIVEVDLNSKYPGATYCGGTADSVIVGVFAGEHTLRGDPEHHGCGTEIIFDLPGHEWEVISEAARYTWRIALYRRPEGEGQS